MNAKQRADELRARADIRAWVKKFHALARTMPKDVWVYVASGTPYVMARDSEGRHFMLDHRGPCERSDPDAVIDSIARGGWDGGDW